MGAKARMNKLDRRVPHCLDKDALSLLHTSPWSLEPGRAIVNIHMQSISAQGETPLTLLLREHAVLPTEQKRTKLGASNSHLTTQLNSDRFLASRHHNVALDVVL